MGKKMGKIKRKKMRREHYLVNIIKRVISKRNHLSSYESVRNMSNKRCNTRTTIRKKIIISVVTTLIMLIN